MRYSHLCQNIICLFYVNIVTIKEIFIKKLIMFKIKNNFKIICASKLTVKRILK